MGGRILRILDAGKVAYTFVDTPTEESMRIVPRTEGRLLSRDYAPEKSLRSNIEDWFFSQMATIVYHGGAGTIASVLRAGRSTLIYPFVGDSPIWDAAQKELGGT